MTMELTVVAGFLIAREISIGGVASLTTWLHAASTLAACILCSVTDMSNLSPAPSISTSGGRWEVELKARSRASSDLFRRRCPLLRASACHGRCQFGTESLALWPIYGLSMKQGFDFELPDKIRTCDVEFQANCSKRDDVQPAVATYQITL